MQAKVILESPYAADSDEELRRNIRYARRCMMDSLNRGEAPLVFHMLYPRRVGGPLDDKDPDERERGMAAAKNWYQVATAVVVYTDLGISTGMEKGIELASDFGLNVKFRKLSESNFAPPPEEVKPLFPASEND